MTDLELTPLPEQLRRLAEPPCGEALEIIDREFAQWRILHDRLVAIIASLIDVAVDEGRIPLQQVLDAAKRRTGQTLEALVSPSVGAAEVAALLRAHGSAGEVHVEEDEVRFDHKCGSGLRYWQTNPATATVADQEVAGVPGGRPRYCARCIHTITAHAGNWTVEPPDSAGHTCTWRIATGPTMER